MLARGSLSVAAASPTAYASRSVTSPASHVMAALPWFVPALALAGCGSAEVDPQTDAALDVATDRAFASPDAVPNDCPVRCPPTPPVTGDGCSGLERCTFGDEPRNECRREFYCDGNVWAEEPRPARCSDAGSGACPNSITAAGSACATLSSCAVPDGQCYCHKDVWDCIALQKDCPPHGPNLGEACAKDGVYCFPSYPHCYAHVCQCGVWVSFIHTCE